MGFDLAAWNYKQILRAIIQALQLSKHDPLLGNKMEFAEMLPYPESADQEAAIRRGLGL
jgi:hypothetical protein